MTDSAIERVERYFARFRVEPDPNERIDRDDIDEPSVTFGDLRELLTLAKSVQVSEGWQPIETAPKDGTTVLIFVPTDAPNIAHPTPVFAAYSYGGEWVAQGCSASDGIYLSFDADEPTNWMPLPNPPTLHSTGSEGRSD